MKYILIIFLFFYSFIEATFNNNLRFALADYIQFIKRYEPPAGILSILNACNNQCTLVKPKITDGQKLIRRITKEDGESIFVKDDFSRIINARRMENLFKKYPYYKQILVVPHKYAHIYDNKNVVVVPEIKLSEKVLNINKDSIEILFNFTRDTGFADWYLGNFIFDGQKINLINTVNRSFDSSNSFLKNQYACNKYKRLEKMLLSLPHKGLSDSEYKKYIENMVKIFSQEETLPLHENSRLDDLDINFKSVMEIVNYYNQK